LRSITPFAHPEMLCPLASLKSCLHCDVIRGSGYTAGLGIFCLAFLLRFMAGGLLDDVPFITLFPAILIAALLGGLQVGLVVAILSLLAAWYFFIPPKHSWAIDSSAGFLTLLLFCVTAGIQLFVIEMLSQTVDRLSDERDRVAVLFRELQHRVANNITFVASYCVSNAVRPAQRWA
jgi:two-component system, sensor histidine kinase PdtaS